MKTHLLNSPLIIIKGLLLSLIVMVPISIMGWLLIKFMWAGVLSNLLGLALAKHHSLFDFYMVNKSWFIALYISYLTLAIAGLFEMRLLKILSPGVKKGITYL